MCLQPIFLLDYMIRLLFVSQVLYNQQFYETRVKYIRVIIQLQYCLRINNLALFSFAQQSTSGF